MTLAEKLKQDNLSLEDKLKLIDEAMSQPDAQKQVNRPSVKVQADPMDNLMCLGCQ